MVVKVQTTHQLIATHSRTAVTAPHKIRLNQCEQEGPAGLVLSGRARNPGLQRRHSKISDQIRGTYGCGCRVMERLRCCSGVQGRGDQC